MADTKKKTELTPDPPTTPGRGLAALIRGLFSGSNENEAEKYPSFDGPAKNREELQERRRIRQEAAGRRADERRVGDFQEQGLPRAVASPLASLFGGLQERPKVAGAIRGGLDFLSQPAQDAAPHLIRGVEYLADNPPTAPGLTPERKSAVEGAIRGAMGRGAEFMADRVNTEDPSFFDTVQAEISQRAAINAGMDDSEWRRLFEGQGPPDIKLAHRLATEFVDPVNFLGNNIFKRALYAGAQNVYSPWGFEDAETPIAERFAFGMAAAPAMEKLLGGAGRLAKRAAGPAAQRLPDPVIRNAPAAAAGVGLAAITAPESDPASAGDLSAAGIMGAATRQGLRELLGRGVGKRDVTRILNDRNFAILSADAPAHTPAIEIPEGTLPSEALRYRILDLGYDEEDIIPVNGYYKGGGDSEESFVVRGMTREHALQLGKEFGQNEVIIPEGMVEVNTGSTAPYTGKTLLGDEAAASDFYSAVVPADVVDGPSVFSLQYDFENRIPLEQAARPSTRFEEQAVLSEPNRATLKNAVREHFDADEDIVSGLSDSQLLRYASAASRVAAKAGEPTIKLKRHSSAEGQQILDPLADEGLTGVSSAEKKRFGDPDFQRRLNYYRAEAEPEPQVAKAGKHVYETEVPESLIYNMAEDPDGLVARFAKEGASRLEKEIIDAGYLGYHNPDSGLKSAVAIFAPLGVNKPGQTRSSALTNDDVNRILNPAYKDDDTPINPYTGRPYGSSSETPFLRPPIAEWAMNWKDPTWYFTRVFNEDSNRHLINTASVGELEALLGSAKLRAERGMGTKPDIALSWMVGLLSHRIPQLRLPAPSASASEKSKWIQRAIELIRRQEAEGRQNTRPDILDQDMVANAIRREAQETSSVEDELLDFETELLPLKSAMNHLIRRRFGYNEDAFDHILKEVAYGNIEPEDAVKALGEPGPGYFITNWKNHVLEAFKEYAERVDELRYHTVDDALTLPPEDEGFTPPQEGFEPPKDGFEPPKGWNPEDDKGKDDLLGAALLGTGAAGAAAGEDEEGMALAASGVFARGKGQVHFYSKLQRAIDKFPNPSGLIEDINTYLRKHVSKEELEYTRLPELFNMMRNSGKKKIKKETLQNWMDVHRVEFGEAYGQRVDENDFNDQRVKQMIQGKVSNLKNTLENYFESYTYIDRLAARELIAELQTESLSLEQFLETFEAAVKERDAMRVSEMRANEAAAYNSFYNTDRIVTATRDYAEDLVAQTKKITDNVWTGNPDGVQRFDPLWDQSYYVEPGPKEGYREILVKLDSELLAGEDYASGHWSSTRTKNPLGWIRRTIRPVGGAATVKNPQQLGLFQVVQGQHGIWRIFDENGERVDLPENINGVDAVGSYVSGYDREDLAWEAVRRAWGNDASPIDVAKELREETAKREKAYVVEEMQADIQQKARTEEVGYVNVPTEESRARIAELKERLHDLSNERDIAQENRQEAYDEVALLRDTEYEFQTEIDMIRQGYLAEATAEVTGDVGSENLRSWYSLASMKLSDEYDKALDAAYGRSNGNRSDEVDALREKFEKESNALYQKYVDSGSKVTDIVEAKSAADERIPDLIEKRQAIHDRVEELLEKQQELYAEWANLDRLVDEVKEEISDLEGTTHRGRSQKYPLIPLRETKEYTAMLVRRAIADAIDSGADYITWLPGYMQNRRWGQAWKIDRMELERAGGEYRLIIKDNSPKLANHQFDPVQMKLVLWNADVASRENLYTALKAKISNLAIVSRLNQLAFMADNASYNPTQQAQGKKAKAKIEQINRNINEQLVPAVMRAIKDIGEQSRETQPGYFPAGSVALDFDKPVIISEGLAPYYDGPMASSMLTEAKKLDPKAEVEFIDTGIKSEDEYGNSQPEALPAIRISDKMRKKAKDTGFEMFGAGASSALALESLTAAEEANVERNVNVLRAKIAKELAKPANQRDSRKVREWQRQLKLVKTKLPN